MPSPATATEESILSPVKNDHVKVPFAVLMAYKLSSSDPTYTRPLATAGDELIWSWVA